MTVLSLQDKWIVLLLWLAQVGVTLFTVIDSLLAFVFVPPSQYSRVPWWRWIEYLCTVICFMLSIVEVQLLSWRNPRARFYVGSQTLKGLFFTWNLHYSIRNAITWRSAAQLASLAFDTLTTSLFYIGTAYALLVLHRQRKLEQRVQKASSDTGSVYGNKLEVTPSAFSLPATINSAPQIDCEVPMLIGLIQWVYRETAWTKILPLPLSSMAEWLMFFLRYCASTFLLLFLLPFSGLVPGEPHNSLHKSISWLDEWDYPVPTLARYSDRDEEATSSGNRTDEESAVDTLGLHQFRHRHTASRASHSGQRNYEQMTTTRLLGPRYLCFLIDTYDRATETPYEVRRVDDWLKENNSKGIPDYIFISYTRRQFYTQTVFDSDLSSGNLDNVDKLRHIAQRDKVTLTNQAVVAAKQAGAVAFWVDFECVKAENEEVHEADMEDVYRICDIVRAAHSLVIVLGPPLDSHYNHRSEIMVHKDEWLLEWGKRMWTVPEALLCPSEHRIALYTVGSAESEFIAKRNLAGRVWNDADDLRQLIDHYEGSLLLSQLELISIALECLQRRQTNARNAGDVAYVLMGLLRLRPKVDKTDSDFQAFARLSPANDSNKVIERIICLQHKNPHSPWHDMDDVWGTKLWYLDPLYQVAGIRGNNSVVVGDSSGTSIDWTSLKSVDFTTKNPHNRRWYVSRISTSVATIFTLACLFFSYALQSGFNGRADLTLTRKIFQGIYGVPAVFCLLVATLVPRWLSEHFRSDFTATQARLFGIQGRADLEKIETSIFGLSCGRIRWNADNLRSHDAGDKRPEFTLIDTLSCTATLFRAESPPTVAFVGARERGLFRVLLCSYNHVAQAFVKETVVRLEGTTLQRMRRLDKFRYAIVPTDSKDEDGQNSLLVPDRIDIPDIPEFLSLDDR